MYFRRFASCSRAARSLAIAGTCRAIAAGEKSAMLLNLSLTASFSEPSSAPSLFGTLIVTAGSIAAMRLSKLSMSMSRNFRSFMSGLATSEAFPERSAKTPMTNGSSTSFSAS
jgi:hypothetical protein